MTNATTNKGTKMNDIQKCEKIASEVSAKNVPSAFVRDLLIQRLLRENDLMPTVQLIANIENLIENR